MSMNDSQSWCLQHNHLKQLRHGLTVLEGTPCSDARYYSLSRPPMVRFEAYLVDTFADSFWYLLPVLNQYQYFCHHCHLPICSLFSSKELAHRVGMPKSTHFGPYWNVIAKVLLLDCYWKWFRFRFQLWFRFHPKHVHGSDLVLYIWLKVQTSPDINFKTSQIYNLKHPRYII